MRIIFSEFKKPHIHSVIEYQYMLPIHLISGPRNLSTTLMYAFDSRGDTRVYDEPLYAHYLTHTNLDHPGREEVIRTMSNDAASIIRSVFLQPSTDREKPFVFIKNMAHHLEGLDHDWITQLPTVFLIRDPEAIVRSFSKVMPNMTIKDIGIQLEHSIWKQFEDSNLSTCVLDSRYILEGPKPVLIKLCARLSIPFTERMLTWESGPRNADGCWAKYWYANVHRSTGIGQVIKVDKDKPKDPLPLHLQVIVDQAIPLYQEMAAQAIRP